MPLRTPASCTSLATPAVTSSNWVRRSVRTEISPLGARPAALEDPVVMVDCSRQTVALQTGMPPGRRRYKRHICMPRSGQPKSSVSTGKIACATKGGAVWLGRLLQHGRRGGAVEAEPGLGGGQTLV